MRLAYADPPYPGQAKRHYGNHSDYAGEVNHRNLIDQLCEYERALAGRPSDVSPDGEASGRAATTSMFCGAKIEHDRA